MITASKTFIFENSKNLTILYIPASFKEMGLFSCYKVVLHVVLEVLKCGAFLRVLFPTVHHDLIERIRTAGWGRYAVALRHFLQDIQFGHFWVRCLPMGNELKQKYSV